MRRICNGKRKKENEKIVLIGDSIRQGYDKYVKMAFEGEAQVYFHWENSRFTAFVIRRLLEWKTEMECGDDVDLVHWNAGLWDDLRMPNGKPLTSLETYRENVQRICDILKMLYPKAKIVFATSTPIQEHLFTGPCKRYNADTERYNEVACEVVRANGGAINDLYSTVNGCPREYYSDLAHLYTEAGTRLLTESVVRTIEKCLDIKAKPLDYAARFAKKEDVVGI